MDYVIPEEYLYLLLGALLILAVFAILVRKNCWNYVYPRLKWAYFGGKFIHEVDADNQSNFDCLSCVQEQLKGKDRRHTLEALSTMRNPDGPIVFVHKDMLKALTSQFIVGSNNLNYLGFNSFAHALKFYKAEYYEAEWKKAEEEITKEPNKKNEIVMKVEEKIGLDLMSPVQPDYFTQNLAIVNRFNNQKLSAYGSKNIEDKIKNEAERQGNRGGITAAQIMGYATTILVVLGAITFLLVILKSQGLIQI